MDLYRLITSSRAYMNAFTYDEYPICLAEFERKAESVFHLSENDMDALIDDYLSNYLSLSRWDRKEACYMDRQILALFLSPSADRAGKKEFARRLNERWNETFPKDCYEMGEFNAIMRGFDSNLLGLPLRKSNKR